MSAAEPGREDNTLRQQAENQLKQLNLSRLISKSPNEVQQLIHELQVHQVELELQQEELRAAQHALAQSEARYRNLYLMAPNPYFSLNPQGGILEANFAASAMLGLGRRDLNQQLFRNFVAPGDKSEFDQFFTQLLHEQAPGQLEIQMHSFSGQLRTLVLEGVALETEETESKQFLISCLDITERRLVEDKLREEHSRLTNAEALGKIGSFERLWKEDILTWSDEMYRMHGLEPQSELMTVQKTIGFVHPEDQPVMREALSMMQASGVPLNLTQRLVLRDGTIRHVQRRAELIRDVSGQPYRIYGTLQDISEHVAAEQKIRESEALLREAEIVGQMGSYEANAHTMKFRFSDGMFRLLGVEPQSVIPTLDWIDSLSHPDDARQIRHILQKAVAEKQPYQYLLRIYLPNGELRYLFSRGIVMTDAQGSVIKLLGTAQDITERKKAEAEIQESQHFISQVAETVPDMINVFDLKAHTISYLNHAPAGLEAFQYEQMSSADRIKLVHPSDFEAIQRYFESLTFASDTDIRVVEYRSLRPGGEWLWLRSRGKVFRRDAAGVPTHCVNVVQNIHSQKQAEADLLKSLALMQQSEEAAGMGSWEYDLQTGDYRWSEGMYRIFGLPADVSLDPGIYWKQALTEDRPLAQRLADRIRRGEGSFEETLRIRYGDGNKVLRVKANAVKDETGKAVKMLGLDIDVTTLYEAETQVKESQQLVQAVFDASPVAILLTKSIRQEDQDQPIQDFEVLLSNRQAEQQLGKIKRLSESSWLQQPGRDSLLHHLRTIARNNQSLSFETRIQSSDAIRWVSVSLAGLNEGVVIVSEDITERKKMEAEFLQLKLDQHRQISHAILQAQEEEKRRIAEALHNGLAQQLYAVYIRLQGIRLDKLPEALEEASANKVMAEKLQMDAINQTRRLSHELTPLMLEDYGLKDAIEEFCRNLSHDDLQLRCQVKNVKPGLEKYLGIAIYRISQELANNIIRHSQASAASIQIVQENRWISVQARDNGQGFDVSKLSQKGMGMQAIRNRVDLLGGTMNIESQPGEGTRVIITLPLSSSEQRTS